MKTLAPYFLMAIILVSCGEKNGPDIAKSSRPNKSGMERRFYTQDTISIPAGPMEFFGTRLSYGPQVIDTIFIDARWSKVDSAAVVYQKIETYDDTAWNPVGSTAEKEINKVGVQGGIIVFDGKSKQNITEQLPLFTEFSSPAFWKGCVHYWGLKKKEEGFYGIFAMKFNVRNKNVDSLYLFDARLATDNIGYFASPQVMGESIIYQCKQENQFWMVDADFTKGERRENPSE